MTALSSQKSLNKLNNFFLCESPLNPQSISESIKEKEREKVLSRRSSASSLGSATSQEVAALSGIDPASPPQGDQPAQQENVNGATPQRSLSELTP